MRVGYQGAEGAFSHEACLRYLSGYEPVAFATFADVLAAVQTGTVERGMLPLVNNQAGETGVRELLEGSLLRVLDEVVLPVRMHLLGMPGARLGDIEEVISHPIALRQCSRYLAQMGVKMHEMPNTALAAEALGDKRRAVLASAAAAKIYGLTVLAEDVHDREDNATRFVIVAKQ